MLILIAAMCVGVRWRPSKRLGYRWDAIASLEVSIVRRSSSERLNEDKGVKLDAIVCCIFVGICCVETLLQSLEIQFVWKFCFLLREKGLPKVPIRFGRIFLVEF